MPDTLRASKEDQAKIAAFIKKHSRWSEQLKVLREVLQSCGLQETVKWGIPTYVLEASIVVSIGAFKNHYALWFHQGVFLKDSKKKLVNAQEGTTKAMRQWKFEEGDSINVAVVKSYTKEAVANQRAGKEVKPKSKKMNMPEELSAQLSANKKLDQAFSELSPGKQREYAQHVIDAKLQKTRLSRIEKITPMILSGAGLNDKYRNC